MSRLPYAAAFVTVTLWASAFPAVRYVLGFFSPASLMLYRFIIASAFLLAYCAIMRIPPPDRKDIPLFTLSGFTGLFLYMWAFNAGTAHVPAGVSSFIISSAPMLTLVLTVWLLKEKATPLIWAGASISLIGIGIISLSSDETFKPNIGILLLILASIFTSFYNIIQKKILIKYTAMQATAYSIALGTLPMFVFVPVFLREFPHATASAHWIVVYLAIFPAAIAFWLWVYALSKASKIIYVTSFSYLSPFLATIFAFFLLGETIPALSLIGGGVVILGMVMASIKNEKRVTRDEVIL